MNLKEVIVLSKNKVCIICAKKYKFCGHCNKISSDELWHNIYCSEECREIFNTCSRYEGKDISADEAYDKLVKYNFTDKNIQLSVKGTIEKIINNQTKTNNSPSEKSKLEPTPEVEVKTNVSEEVTDNSEKPKRRPRRRRMKKIDE